MKRINLLAIGILGVLLCGCNQPGNNKQQSSEEKQSANASEQTVLNVLSEQEKAENWLRNIKIREL